ncbi:MAG: hypothetical protein ACM3L8_07580 [Verrucomicrobiota bacterium]
MPAAEAVRFASRVVSKPGRAVSLWKAVSGWKAVRCPPGFPAPEILHSVTLLPVVAGLGDDPFPPDIPCDAWIIDPALAGRAAGIPSGAVHLFPEAPCPTTMEAALDRVEALAEWAESASGRRCSEGALERSLRAYGEREARRQALLARAAAAPAFLGAGELELLLRCGNFLPVESHARLLGQVVGGNLPAPPPAGGDPFLTVARRLARKPAPGRDATSG